MVDIVDIVDTIDIWIYPGRRGPVVVVLVFVAVQPGPGGDGGSLARHVLVIAPSSHIITVS